MPLGILVDHMLQPIVKTVPSYFKDSFALAKLLKNQKVSKKCSIFSFGAIYMYTNVNTDECLARLTGFLTRPSTETRFSYCPAKALVEALALVMKKQQNEVWGHNCPTTKGDCNGHVSSPHNCQPTYLWPSTKLKLL